MAARKKKVDVIEPAVDIELLCQIDDTYLSLVEKYFELALTEKIGLTKVITAKLDKLEIAIAKRKEEIKNGQM